MHERDMTPDERERTDWRKKSKDKGQGTRDEG